MKNISRLVFCSTVGFAAYAAWAIAQPPNASGSLVRVLATPGSNAGIGYEIHRLAVAGFALDEQNEPVPNATIFAVATPNRRPGDFEAERFETTTDERGRFRFDAMEVLVVTQDRPQSRKESAEFCIFGVAEGYGFTWSQTCTFRPKLAPASRNDFDRAVEGANSSQLFYVDNSPEVNLVFSSPATFAGVLADDLGAPLTDAEVQVGYVHNTRLGRKYGSRRCTFSPGGDTMPVNFAAIESLPAKYREVRTDDSGAFRLEGLRRESEYMVLMQPKGLHDSKRITLFTKAMPRRTPDPNSFYTDDGAAYAGQFICPRSLKVSARSLPNQQPVAGCTVIAVGDRMRLSGNLGITNSEGVAQLQLPPGSYKLRLEPPLDATLVYHESPVTVTEARETDAAIDLPSAAMVVLNAIDTEADSPIPAVRFNYLSGTVQTPLPVSTQTVVADYASTDSSGRLKVRLPPGRVTFVVNKSPTAWTPEESRSAMLELEAGQTTEVTFRFTRTRDANEKQVDSSLPQRTQISLRKQLRLLQESKVVVRINSALFTSDLTLDDMRDALDAVPATQVPDIRAIYEQLTGKPLRLGGRVITCDGQRRKEQRLPADAADLVSGDYSLFNGREGVVYRAGNGQIDVYPQSSFRIHVAGLADFVNQISPRGQFGCDVIADQCVLTTPVEAGKFEAILDADTGFLVRNFYLRNGSGRAQWQFGRKQLENGLLLPELSVEARIRDHRITSIEINELTQVQLKNRFPADTFAAPVPAGTTFVDHVNLLTDAPSRRNVTVLKAPVTDAATYVRRRHAN